MSETNIENIIINELLTAYGDNPNKVRKVVEKKLIEYEAFGKGQMAYIMKMALYYFNQFLILGLSLSQPQIHKL